MQPLEPLFTYSRCAQNSTAWILIGTIERLINKIDLIIAVSVASTATDSHWMRKYFGIEQVKCQFTYPHTHTHTLESISSADSIRNLTFTHFERLVAGCEGELCAFFSRIQFIEFIFNEWPKYINNQPNESLECLLKLRISTFVDWFQYKCSELNIQRASELLQWRIVWDFAVAYFMAYFFLLYLRLLIRSYDKNESRDISMCWSVSMVPD